MGTSQRVLLSETAAELKRRLVFDSLNMPLEDIGDITRKHRRPYHLHKEIKKRIECLYAANILTIQF